MTDGPYRWWVYAVGPANVRSLWSSPVDIHVGGRPDVLGPIGNSSDRTPTFRWTAVSGAASYQLWVDRREVAQSAVINLARIISASYTPTVSLAKGVYRIWVRAISTTGQRSVWSQPVDVSIKATGESTEPFQEYKTKPGNLMTTSVRREAPQQPDPDRTSVQPDSDTSDDAPKVLHPAMISIEPFDERSSHVVKEILFPMCHSNELLAAFWKASAVRSDILMPD